MSQSEAGGVGWTQVIGMVLGACLVMAAFFTFAWFNRRSRAALRERPPQKTKLLRPPGYSLHCRIDELTEKWSSTVMQAVLAGSVLGLLCGGLYPLVEALVLQRVTFSQVRAQPRSYVILSLAALIVSALAWLVASLVRAVQCQRNLRNCQFGLRGEQAVAEALADRTIAAAGYTSFHDVPGDGTWNIDHLVIGPGGIFVLETKTRSRRKPLWDQPDQKVYYDGQRLLFPWCEDGRVVGQVQRNVDWVRQFVAGFAPNNVTVQPVIVVPGWFVETQGAYPVHAMNAEYLKKYIAKSKPRFTEDELQGVVRRLDERCRDLEF
jgi:hypothetical protein